VAPRTRSALAEKRGGLARAKTYSHDVEPVSLEGNLVRGARKLTQRWHAAYARVVSPANAC